MTRKDYELIAEILRKSPVSQEARQLVAEEFSDHLWLENSKFDQERFVAAATTGTLAADRTRA